MNKTISFWGPRLLLLILAAVGCWACIHAGLLHVPAAGTAFLSGAGVLHAVGLPIADPSMWKTSSLTDSINKLIQLPTKIGDSKLFDESGINTTTATFDDRNGILSLVQSSPRGSDPTAVAPVKAKTRVLPAAHLAEAGIIKPEDLQDLRPFGETTVVQQQAKVINDRLLDLKNRLSATREWHQMGALHGQVLDADGSVLVDLYDAFGVTKKTASLALATSTTDVRAKILAAKRAVEPLLGGVMVNGWRAYCSPTFFDALTGNDSVKDAYKYYQAAADRLGGDMRQSFVYAGVEWIEYNATISSQAFVTDKLAYFFPVAQGLYKIYNAPADWNETVNTVGLPYYSKAEERRMGRGMDIEAQSNPLAVCLRPDVLTEMTLEA
jgi:Phage major capsid protein E